MHLRTASGVFRSRHHCVQTSLRVTESSVCGHSLDHPFFAYPATAPALSAAISHSNLRNTVELHEIRWPLSMPACGLDRGPGGTPIQWWLIAPNRLVAVPSPCHGMVH